MKIFKYQKKEFDEHVYSHHLDLKIIRILSQLLFLIEI